MVFKGTPDRTALDMAQAFDAVGGDLNAFTTKEAVCFHARVLGRDMPMAMDALADVVSSPTLDASELLSERAVVLEEIAMSEDTPEEIVFEAFSSALLGSHPLGRPIAGTVQTVEAIDASALQDFHRGTLWGAPMVVAAAGDVSHEQIAEAAARLDAARAPLNDGGPPVVRSAFTSIPRDIEQTHIVYGTAGLARGDDRRWAFWVLNVALGGGLSSRLFQEIREKRGLAYSVSSGNQAFADGGIFSLYAACAPENANEVLSLAREQIDDLLGGGITEEEVVRAIGHLRASFAMSMDDPSAVMSHLGKHELLLGETPDVDAMIARIEGVTTDEVSAVAADLFGSAPWALTVLGAMPDSDVTGFVREAA